VDRKRQVRSNEIGVFQGTQDRKAAPEARFDDCVHGFGVANALGDQRDCFAPQRVLHPIADEPGHVLFDHRGGLSDRCEQVKHGAGCEIGRAHV